MAGIDFSTNVSSFTYEIPAENSAARIFRLAEDSETNSVAIVGNYAYVAHEYGPAGDPVYVFDISNPAVPKAVCYFDLNASFYNITASENYLYAVWNKQIYPIDVSDPVNPEVMRPVEIASTELTSVLDLYIDGSTLYYTGSYSYSSSTRVGAIDISNPAVPVNMDYILFSGRPFKMTCSNGYVYIANGYTADASLAIVDATDPKDLKQIYLGVLDDNLSYTTGISIDDDYLYVSDDGYQIEVVNITAPAAPVYVKTVEPSGTRSLGILLVSGNSLYGVNRGIVQYSGWIFQAHRILLKKQK